MKAEGKEKSDILVTGSGSVSAIRFSTVGTLSSFADPGRTVIVADSVTADFVPAEFPRKRIILVERGESAKCLASLESLYARFLKLELGRDWTVVALGGGSVSDLAGFASSTWMRGIDFGFVPTTLLAMVDASVGGKNGIDYGGFKNLVGCFSQPRFVLVDPALLATLPDADLACGFAEAVKHGIIGGEEHFSLLERAVLASGKIDRNSLAPMIRSSIELKAKIVNADEKEAGDRRKLNLGHTFGHAIEAETGLPHGACVATGLACALRLSAAQGNREAPVTRAVALLNLAGLPTEIGAAQGSAPAGKSGNPAVFREALAAAIGLDKKRQAESVLFAMPKSLGNVTIEAVALDALRDFARSAP